MGAENVTVPVDYNAATAAANLQIKNSQCKSIKLVVVGNNSVGKSCLIKNYLHGYHSVEYKPSMCDVYKGPLYFKLRQEQALLTQLDIEIQDTNGEVNQDILRQNRLVQYKDVDVAIICVAADNRTSFDDIQNWMTEIDSVSSAYSKPRVLVLTKNDVPDDQRQVTEEEIRVEAKAKGFQAYFMTSSEGNSESVQTAFVGTITTGYRSKYEYF